MKPSIRSSHSARLTALAAVLAAGTHGVFPVFADAGSDRQIPGRLELTVRGAAGAETDAELLVYGDIGDSWFGDSVTASSVVTQLQGLNASSILVRINSYGGSVTDGTAIYNALRNTGAAITTRVDGVAASIAGLIAMAGDTLEMSSNTLLMIHAPWTMAVGNSAEMRQAADVLDTFANAMATSYARKSGKTAAEELPQLTDGQDHWFTADQAKAAGYADTILDEPKLPDEDAAARARPVLAAMSRYRTAPAAVAASLKTHFSAALTPSRKPPKSPAASAASHQESRMDYIELARALGLQLADNVSAAAAKAAVLAHLKLEANATDAAIAAALVKQTQAGTHRPESADDSEETRRAVQIDGMFAIASRSRPNDTALQTMHALALLDTDKPLADIRKELMAAMSNKATPTAGGHVVAGEDEIEKRQEGMVKALLGRVGKEKVDGKNEFRGFRLTDMARACLEYADVDTRGMSPHAVAEMALGVNQGKSKRGKPSAGASGPLTTGDFPAILEKTVEKLMLDGFNSQPATWSTFCKVGDVGDFREYERIVPAFIGTLDEVNEAGEYKNKQLPDMQGQRIKVKRHGNIIEVTPELIANDYIGVIKDMAEGVGRNGNRTIERAVYKLLLSNPLLRDGYALFSPQHGNIAAAGSAPSVVSLDAGRTAVSLQKLPVAADAPDDEYADIVPAIAVVNTNIQGLFKVIVGSEFDPDANTKLQRANAVKGLVETIVVTPRTAAASWYLFADPAVAPVLEVLFLDGQREPELVMDENFRTDGMAWKGRLPFGVGAIDWRGGYFNPGQPQQ